MANTKITYNRELNIWEALVPLIFLIAILALNVFYFGDDSLAGSNQFALLLAAAVAAVVGYFNKVSYYDMMEAVADNFKATTGAFLILLFVGSLVGTWLLSGVIPAMVYYGLLILKPGIFLPATVIICAIISMVTGSSWTTSATVGIALIGISGAIGIPVAMTAGAVLSGAYFGDKMSPLSDTTNLAAAMAGADLFDHIRYMMLTTVPSISIALVVFIILGAAQDPAGQAETMALLENLQSTFNINLWLFLVPATVIIMIIRKAKPIAALLAGTLLGAVFALIFQPDIVAMAGGDSLFNFSSAYRGIMNAMTVEISIPTENENLADLYTSGGMSGMIGTIWLVMCAMTFGGVMEAIGALSRISSSLLKISDSIFSLFASTVASCLALNVTASDQYLSIVVSGKMFKKSYEEKGLAPVNLSRTLEDSGTVTSVLVPWNTCGAYQSSVLGVSTLDYFVYAVFNYISPFMTLLFAALSIKIRSLVQKETLQ